MTTIEVRSETCYRCSGNGCWACHDGAVMVEFRTCPACDGWGRYGDDIVCGACNGLGEVGTVQS